MALKIIITRMLPYEGEDTKAFFDAKCAIAGYEFFYNDLTLVKSKKTGLFVGFPSKPGTEAGKYYKYSWANDKAREELLRVAIADYHKKVKEQMDFPPKAA